MRPVRSPPERFQWRTVRTASFRCYSRSFPASSPHRLTVLRIQCTVLDCTADTESVLAAIGMFRPGMADSCCCHYLQCMCPVSTVRNWAVPMPIGIFLFRTAHTCSVPVWAHSCPQRMGSKWSARFHWQSCPLRNRSRPFVQCCPRSCPSCRTHRQSIRCWRLQSPPNMPSTALGQSNWWRCPVDTVHNRIAPGANLRVQAHMPHMRSVQWWTDE